MKKSPEKSKNVSEKLSAKEITSRKFDNRVNEVLGRKQQFCPACGIQLQSYPDQTFRCPGIACELFLAIASNSQMEFDF